MPQLHQILIIWPQGSQSPGWQGLKQACEQSSKRGFKHSDSHFLQLLPASTLLEAFLTRWQSRSQVWFWQGSCRPHFRPQLAALASKQGQSEVSWPPKHVIGTGNWQGGQVKLLISVLGPWLSHGVAAFLAFELSGFILWGQRPRELHIRAKFDEAEGRGELCTGDWK